MSNLAMLARMGESLGRAGIGFAGASDAAADPARKSETPIVPTTAHFQGSEFMNQPQVEALVDLTVSQSGWLSGVSLKLRNQRSGTIPRLVINDVVTEGVPENGGRTVATAPDTSEINYEARKFQATWYLTLEDIGEARAAGESDFDGRVRRAFSKAMGNDLARAGLRGDTALGQSTRLDRLLRQRDGWLKQARSSANYLQTTRGTAWSRALYPAMKRQLPTEYKDDPNLRWLHAPELDEDFTNYLQTIGGDAGLRDSALIERKRYAPMGIPPLLVPQWPTDQGFASVSGASVDADAVADDGDGTLTATVNTLFGGYSAAFAGRQVTITNDATGESETLTVIDTGAALVIRSAGSLGQGAISTTAADYTLDLADMTGCILTNPRNLFVVLCRGMRAYRKFEQEAERWRIDVYYEADFGIFQPDALVLQEGIVPSSLTFGS